MKYRAGQRKLTFVNMRRRVITQKGHGIGSLFRLVAKQVPALLKTGTKILAPTVKKALKSKSVKKAGLALAKAALKNSSEPKGQLKQDLLKIARTAIKKNGSGYKKKKSRPSTKKRTKPKKGKKSGKKRKSSFVSPALVANKKKKKIETIFG